MPVEVLGDVVLCDQRTITISGAESTFPPQVLTAQQAILEPLR